MRLRACLALTCTAFAAGCAHRAVPPAAQIAAPAPAYAEAPLPAFAAPGMTIPAALPDGSYPLPSTGLSTAGAAWHVRAALNVAALSCASPAIVGGYNRLLAQRRVALAVVQRAYAGDVRAGGAPGGYDATMTRLYNFYAQYPARAGFCAAAQDVIAALAPLSDADLAAAAPGALAALDRPFVDFYRAYDAWRAHRPLPQTSIALVAATSPAPAARPRIELGGDIFAGRDDPVE